MAREIMWRHSSSTASLYAVVSRVSDGQVWNGAALEAFAVANWADYDLPLAETPAASYEYVTDMPAVAAGVYAVRIYQQAGAAPAISDELVADGEIVWDGTAEVYQTGDSYAKIVHATYGLPAIKMAIGDIAAGSAPLNAVAQDATVTEGEETNSYLDTKSNTATYHQVADDLVNVGEIDFEYEFTPGVDAVPIGVTIVGRLDSDEVPAGTDVVDIYAWNYQADPPEWEHISGPSGDFYNVKNSTAADDMAKTIILFPRFINGSGTVKIRLAGTGLDETAEMFVRFIFIGYVSVRLGLTTAALADVNAEVDTALADYDGPTRAEATADKDEILASDLAGSGAYTITVTVTDGTDAIAGATVRMTKGVETFISTSNVNGKAVFGLNGGTYVLAATAAGYSYAGSAPLITGDAAINVAMTAIVIPAATEDNQTTGYGYTRDAQGDAEAGIPVQLELVTPTTDGIHGRVQLSEKSDANGLVTLLLLKSATYRIRRSESLFWKQFTTGSGTTTELPVV